MKTSSLTNLFYILLVLFCSIILTVYFSVISQRRDQGLDAKRINVAGRQRMLSQKVAKLALKISHDSEGRTEYIPILSQTLNEWLSAHRDLARGSLAESNFEGDFNIADSLIALDKYVNLINKAGLHMITSAQQSSTPQIEEKLQQQLQIISTQEPLFLESMDRIVKQLELNVKSSYDTMSGIIKWAVIFSLGLPIAATLFVVTPAIRSFKRTQKALVWARQQIGQQNQNLQARQEELDQKVSSLKELNTNLAEKDKELLSQKIFYEAILNDMPIDVVAFNQQHQYVFVNPYAIRDEEIRKWIIGKDDFEYCEYRNKPKSLAQTRRTNFNKVLETGKEVEWEDSLVDRDGKPRHFIRRLTPIYDRGQLRIVIGYGMEITDRKLYEQALIESRKYAEAASEAKAEFLSTMSHEIRTPLNAVIGITHLLQQEEPKPEQEENLNILRFSSENLLSLINDILDFSKIESGKVTLEQVPFNLHTLISSLNQSFQFHAREKNIDLKLIIDPGVPEALVGDPGRITQVLNNLLSNAIKFTEKGGVKLRITLNFLKEEKVGLRFSVRDTGIGIAKEKQSEIFNSFTQADTYTTRKYGGTGLGLTITKKLLELYESDIEVKSKLGEGTEFFFDIILVAAEEKAVNLRKEAATAESVSLKGVHILMAEDNPVNVILAQKFLTKWGIELEVAENGLEAVEMTQKKDYDLVLMDLQMPKMDGYQAAQAIRKDKNDTPIVALTASALLDVQQKVYESGMNDFLCKPFNPKDLFQKIAQYTQETT